MNNIRKISVLAFLLLFFTGFVAADLEVAPNSVNETLAAGEEHVLEFSFTNTNENQSIQDVTLEERDWLSWNQTGFQLNEAETRDVNATFQTETPEEINTILETLYETEDGNQSSANPIQFIAETYYEETEISVDVFQNEFERDFEEQASSVLSIENTGSETAYNVNLSGDNARFDDDLFDLEPGEQELIEYNASVPMPDKNITESTNQTYTLPVNVSGDNFEQDGFDIEIFVPFQEYDEEEQQRDLVDMMLEIQEYCSENPDLPICGGDMIEIVEEVEVVEETTETNVTLSEEEITDLRTLSNSSIDTTADVEAALAQQDNRTASYLENLTRDLETAFQQQQQAYEENTESNNEVLDYIEGQQQNRTIIFLLGLVWFIFVSLLGLVALMVKILQDSNSAEPW
ncbi:hypothetical protein OB919_15775 [Halobacteria archaeon AArc-curdl1]|uniref:Uncharacterized protein n=1 Tax=Natronosalvus hydrolyticus TaxID=2979988 RepID=A0AAP2ZAH2_9EURY|nr:hypothetical protein [Halobacteria archaeon AArc-curdl1]